MDADQVWQEMRLHIEWAEGFCLCVVFTDQTRELLRLQQRLADAWQWRTAAITVIRPPDAESAVEHVFSALEQHRVRLPDVQVPVWLDLCTAPDAENALTPWERARHHSVARLNEARSWLMRDLARPLVLCLPLHWSSRLATEAPDLWHVRAYSARMQSVVPVDPVPAQPVSSAPADGEAIHWAQWSVHVATMAEEVLRFRRLREALGDSPQLLRDLSVSLIKLGDAQREAGQGRQALEAYRESLGLMRQLREALGDSPQVLRDLSVALEKLGDAQREAGQGGEALEAYRESLGLRRQLREALGDSPQVLRDLSISLDSLGDAQLEAGQGGQALEACRESLGLMRQLREALGDSPQVLRDLSVALEKLGDVQREAGQGGEALEAYLESLGLRRQLREALGDSPRVLDDLAVSLERLAGVEPNRQQRVVLRDEALAWRQRLVDGCPDPLAQSRYRQRLELARRLFESDRPLGDNPGSV